jgi:Type ISP C-terminal specificity domain/N-6 DNA Methylase
MEKALGKYALEVAELIGSPSTREETYYPAVRSLLIALLEGQSLPFQVRSNTSEKRAGGGTDLPDVALYDGEGDYLAVCGEVKLPSSELEEMAGSTEGGDQVGRYLAQTRVVILCNIRGFALLVAKPDAPRGPVGPKHRRLEHVVELWPSALALRQAKPIAPGASHQLAELVETAVTRLAPISEPQSLARILARQARQAKAALPKQFTAAVQDLLDDFGKALGISFEGKEGEEFFRSSLVQTAFYGLFAAWTLWRHSKSKRPFRWEDLSDYLRIPFLGELFYEFKHPKRIHELNLAHHLDVATETLERVDTDRFFARFRLATLGTSAKENRERAEIHAASAITYFYEPFLEAFDPDLRKELGVWYTPPEIVRYQVRKVDAILRKELGCERGFADPQVIALDPCCGTGAYLTEVLQCVSEQLQSEGVKASLGAELLDAACRRVVGFEILTAPFVIAQLQTYLMLSELGAEPGPKHRPAVFLTNALTGWASEDQLKLHFPEMQQEHDAARKVKRDAKIIVILGNPPYNRFVGAPMAEEQDLLDHYKGIKRDPKGKQIGQSDLWTRFKVRKHLLDDLYVRFFRLAERQIGERAEHGVVSYISNSSYLVGRSHPLMRESLLKHFPRVWIDNLHGNRIASERTPWGDSCQTIFSVEGGGPGIKVGTSISTFLKGGSKAEPPVVSIRDFWGKADEKRRALLESLEMESWPKKQKEEAAKLREGPRRYEASHPTLEASWRFAPSGATSGFEEWPSIDDLFPARFQGVNPNRGLDGSVVDMDAESLSKRMQDYYSSIAFVELKRRHPELCEPRARYEPERVRTALRKVSSFHSERVAPYLLFPLDQRWLYYETEGKLLNERRPGLWENVGGNGFLVAVPQPRRPSEARPLFATSLFDLHLHDRGSVGFPIRTKPEATPRDLFTNEGVQAPGQPRPISLEPPQEAVVSMRQLGGRRRSEAHAGPLLPGPRAWPCAIV